MAGEEPRVATYQDFISQVIPRIKAGGYTAIQLMAIQVIGGGGQRGPHGNTRKAPGGGTRGA